MDRNDIPVVAYDCMHVADDIVIARPQSVIGYPPQVPVNLVLEFPTVGFIVGFRLLR